MAASGSPEPLVSDSNRNRWFHPGISLREAETLLLTKGRVGSYLVRESGSRPGSYALSVRTEPHITHVRISKYGDYYDTEDGSDFDPEDGTSGFASIAEFVQYYTEEGNKLMLIDGSVIDAKYPLYRDAEVPQPPRPSDPWFHGRLDSKLAETMLIEQGILNSFLVRERSHVPGEFVLSVLTNPDLVTNAIVLFQSGHYFFKGDGVADRFPSLLDLVEYYKKNPVRVQGSSELIRLGEPLQVQECLKKSSGQEDGKPKNKKNLLKRILP